MGDVRDILARQGGHDARIPGATSTAAKETDEPPIPSDGMTELPILPLSTPRLVLRALRADGRRGHPPISQRPRRRPATRTGRCRSRASRADELATEQADARGPFLGGWIQLGVEHEGELIGRPRGRASTAPAAPATIGYTLRPDRLGPGLRHGGRRRARGRAVRAWHVPRGRDPRPGQHPPRHGCSSASGSPTTARAIGCRIRAWRVGRRRPIRHHRCRAGRLPRGTAHQLLTASATGVRRTSSRRGRLRHRPDDRGASVGAGPPRATLATDRALRGRPGVPDPLPARPRLVRHGGRHPGPHRRPTRSSGRGPRRPPPAVVL